MATQSDQERTEAPTQRRRDEAANEGRVPRSVELTTAALFLGTAVVINAGGGALGSRAATLFADGLRSIGDGAGAGASIALLQRTGFIATAIISVMCLALGGAVFAVAALQARGTFTFDPLQPKFSRINPIANISNRFGWQSIADLVRSLLKVALVAIVTWKVLSAAWPDFVDLGSRDAGSLLLTIRGYMVSLLVTTGGAYLVLGAADYGFQYWTHVRGMRMTKDEVRQETKQQEGDQLVKSRIRAVARARIRRQMFADVPKADVVIVNPTHRAVALRYDPLTAPAPVVIAMGERRIAERIKAIAREHGVPMIENRPLARALIATARIGTVIPAELYTAVAEILAFVYRQRAMRGDPAAWSGKVVQ